MQAPIISEDIWGDDLKAVEQCYYTVYVYKHTGLGQEATFENVLADSQEDAMARVAGSNPWLRTNPMYAYKQDGRI